MQNLTSWTESCFIILKILVKEVTGISNFFPIQNHNRAWNNITLNSEHFPMGISVIKTYKDEEKQEG